MRLSTFIYTADTSSGMWYEKDHESGPQQVQTEGRRQHEDEVSLYHEIDPDVGRHSDTAVADSPTLPHKTRRRLN
ncbi:hypothetical protein PROFUN_02879 [Planoprotostelium fungivorum]|uniref:Uncharacterized protein n=1 Tax=Planoprotostelium fungivorum TaxID=1890364 RepID=A0A2P6NS30_9EUKA|nr:hypothetical protein PROFUN_02879 [Planoprotostelium fungivorum]